MNITHCTGVADSSRKSRDHPDDPLRRGLPRTFRQSGLQRLRRPGDRARGSVQLSETGFCCRDGPALGFLERQRALPSLESGRVDRLVQRNDQPPVGKSLRRSREITSQITGRKADRHDVAAEVLDPFLGRFERRDPSDESEGRPLVGLVEKSFRVKRDLRPVSILPGGDLFKNPHLAANFIM